MTHHLTSDPLVLRNGRRFIDQDYGFRDHRAEPSASHIQGWLTRKAKTINPVQKALAMRSEMKMATVSEGFGGH